MPFGIDSLVSDADGSGAQDPDNIFKLPPFVVSERPLSTFSDYAGGNIFDYGLGTITQSAAPVTFGGGAFAPPTSTQRLEPLPVQGVYEQVYNDELARTNAARARQNLPALTSLDRDEISRIADFAVSQVGKIYDDAQRDLDRTQAARQIGGAQMPIPVPLPIPGDLANVLNAAQLAALISSVARESNLNVPTPATPQEVVSAGGDLSQIGGVPASPGVAPSTSQTGSGVLGTIGQALGGLTGVAGGATGILSGGGAGMTGTTTQTTSSTTPVIVTPGATGGSTNTGSSTPSTVNPGGTITPSGADGINAQTGLNVMGQVLSNVGRTSPASGPAIDQGINAQTGLAIMTQAQSNVGRTNLQVNPPAGETSTSTTTTVFTTTSTSTSTTGSTSTGSNFTIALNYPASTYTAMPINPAQRNIFTEGLTSGTAFTALTTTMSNMYGGLSQGYQQQDVNRLYGLADPNSQFAQAQQGLTGMASAQTEAANRALREGNLEDVLSMQQRALEARQAANPELYQVLNQLTGQAERQAASDFERMQMGGRLSSEEVRNAQQAAREAYAARGQVMGPGAVSAEILNRQALQQQREQQARQNYQQSFGNLGAATQMQMANIFDPFATLLGQQYGMQTQNVGTTQGLFQQAGNLAAGNLAYQPVVQTYNPFGVYPADVYGTNVNAVNAAQINEANRAAALEAAKLGQTGTYASALGSFLGSQTGQNALSGLGGWLTGLFTPSTGTRPSVLPP